MDLELKKVHVRDYIESRINKEPKWLSLSSIMFLTIHGSTCYGLDTEYSDVDIAGILIQPKQFFYGFLNSVDQLQCNKPDGAIYNIVKFFRLASDCNPNVIELLWVDPKYWVYDWSPWHDLIKHRDLFLSKKVRYTYEGYATAQLKRIKTHKKWLISPPTHKPIREEFKLSEQRMISRDQQGALAVLIEAKEVTLSDNFMAMLQAENAYTKSLTEWNQYNNWKETRNEKRAELEAKFGYDTKHAAHLVRLTRQGKEILKTGAINVERPDRDELLAIRAGAWSYDQLMEWYDKETNEVEMQTLYDNSILPREPNRTKLDEICVYLVDKYCEFTE
jgi:predicted nucleotidyltransferase